MLTRWCWLDVHEHVSNTRVRRPDCILDPMRELMALAYRNSTIHLDVQVNVVADTHFAHETFVEINHAGRGAGLQLLQGRIEILLRCAVLGAGDRRAK